MVCFLHHDQLAKAVTPLVWTFVVRTPFKLPVILPMQDTKAAAKARRTAQQLLSDPPVLLVLPHTATSDTALRAAAAAAKVQ